MRKESINSGMIAWFAMNPVAANLLMLVILLAGVATAVELRIEGFPSISPSTVTIDVSYESGDVRQVEEGVAIKIEEALQGVPGIKRISSATTANGVSIQVERTSGYDLDRLSADIKNQIDGVSSFPELAEQPVISQQLWEEDALWIAAYGDVEQRDLQDYARRFEKALLALPSVQKVNMSGWRTPEIAIELDEHRLQAHDLTLADVAAIIRAESLSETNGELRSRYGNIYLKADKQRYKGSEFSEIVLRMNSDGSLLTLGDVATITDGYEETPYILSRYQNKRAINFEVIVDRDDDIVEIANEAKNLVTLWQHSERQPSNIQLNLWWDQSANMLERLNLIIENGVIGIALVMLVLSIFLNIKVAFWVAMGLPVCFAGGLLLMGESFWDLTLNQLTTFGFVLVLGILVDDAVVIGESIYTAQKQMGDSLGDNAGDSVEATIAGVKRVALPTVFGLLTTVAAFYPLSLVEGELGTLFAQFALVCTACLMFSLIESKLILPAHLAHLNTHRIQSNNPFSRAFTALQLKADTLLDRIKHNAYQPFIRYALHYRYTSLCLFLSFFVLVVGMVPSGKVGFSFFPDIPEETITISYTAEQGIGYDTVHQQAGRIEDVINRLNQEWQLQNPESEKIISRYYILTENDTSGHVSLELSPREDRDIYTPEIAARLNKELRDQEGLKKLLVMMEDEDDGDFVLNLMSDKVGHLADATAQLDAFLQQFEGVENITNNLEAGYPQITFDLTEEGRALGLSTENLASQIKQSFYGTEVQRIQRGKDEVSVRVRYPANQRQDLTSLQNARIRTPEGEIVSLLSVANIQQEQTVTEINRTDGYRTATTTADINELVIESDVVMEALEERLFPQILKQYPDIRIVSDGDDAEEKESSQSLVQIFGFSLFLIYILVAIPLKSYWQPLVIMAAIPFGVVGAVLGHWHNDLAISILSINGILALSGVVVNDSLLLVNRFNELRSEGMDIQVAIVEAGSQRMRAILLTSLTTCLGLASLLQETSEQAQFLIPAATSLAYGISFATLISLVLIPVLLMITSDVSRLVKRPSSELKLWWKVPSI